MVIFWYLLYKNSIPNVNNKHISVKEDKSYQILFPLLSILKQNITDQQRLIGLFFQITGFFLEGIKVKACSLVAYTKAVTGNSESPYWLQHASSFLKFCLQEKLQLLVGVAQNLYLA